MEFNEKLQKLRKEEGISQEELAARLNVSRQAVSKWENGQGYPETDKLLALSSLYGVSLDYLLKEEGTLPQADDGSYYASREMVDAYLLAKRQNSRQVALGVVVLILSFLWPLLLSEARGSVMLLLQVAVGVGILVATSFRPRRYAPELVEKPLVFDGAFLRDFRNRYQNIRKKLGGLIVGGILCLFLGMVSQLLLVQFRGMQADASAAVLFIFIAAGVALIILGSSMLSAYSRIAENEKHQRGRRDARRTGWIMSAAMLLGTAVFITLGLGWGLWRPAALVFPAAALLGAVFQTVVNGVRGDQGE